VLNNYPGWLADMINENQCGRAISPDDPVSFADTVVWMRDHQDELCEMGKRSRQLAESRFTRIQLASAFVATLERIYQEGRKQT